MALNKAALKSDILNKLTMPSGNNPAQSSAYFAAQWAAFYNTYALQAQDQSGDFLQTGNTGDLEAGLLSAFTNGTPGGAASAFASAVGIYWTAAPFGIAFPPTVVDPLAISDVSAVVNSTGNVGGLQSTLFGIFNNVDETDTWDLKATQISDALDVQAKSVTVLCNYIATNPAPPPPTLPKVTTLTVS